MSEVTRFHRLEGLEPDNLLAFLALLGVLRSLESADRQQPEDRKLRPRAYWDTAPEAAPLRPVLRVAHPVERGDIAERTASGISILVAAHDFGGRQNLDYSRADARELLEDSARQITAADRDRAELLAALMSDAAIKEEKKTDIAPVDPTPFCLLFGQGWQYFLDRLARVPKEPAPPPRGHGRKAVAITGAECIAEALFAPWHRSDPTFSFRWDPEEDVRYALMAGNPTDSAYKGGTQHGANRLAAVGLAALTLAPQIRAGRVRPAVLGGSSGSGGFSFHWPIWKEPTTLAGIRSLLGHPELAVPGALAHLGVAYTLTTRRIPVGKFMNFTRARVE